MISMSSATVPRTRCSYFFPAATGGIFCGIKSDAAPGTLNSYGPRYTLGKCPPKLSCGGGEVVDHSSVVAFHGLFVAFSPFFRLQKKLMKKKSCPKMVTNAAIEMNMCTGCSDAR